ncbi:hypothetical protein [Zooshikella harenae]|uniref:Uncharacterized protein n=1 Tax=Zooshikella harenae TaxID=2827238 RepID=A0ABS5ZAQ7_9GAMM|nr:hypothetical protein [Zooshikella harenae]MBU2711144.1 hypothetical protein [Zooshikella harenae]
MKKTGQGDDSMKEETSQHADSRIDAIAVIALIIIAVTAMVYWVSGQ